MKIFLRLLLLPLFALAASLPAQTPTSPRFAVIDVQKVLSESKAGQAAFAKLKQMQDERVGHAKKLDEAIRQLQATGRGDEIDRQVTAKRAELQRFSQNADREISEARDRELATLEQKIKPVIDRVATEMQLDAIFNKFESGLVFAAPRLDITETVIKRFNETAP